ncbi:3-dehydro-bile acid delta(4,6)-reductase [Phycisphaerales bacterium]|nr:3-dehydro-bile acid delta(4,6)-reductase [Phycisphaerales bacterium]
MDDEADIAVVGAGAAGLMAAIWAGRTLGASGRVIALDGAKKIGAKILVAGGGRCNVTHHTVDEGQYAGSTPHAIRKVLRRFDVPDTVAFFKALGVELKREKTGKIFPVTDDANTVLSALLGAAADAGVELRHPWRVDRVAREGEVFVVRGEGGGAAIRAGRVIIAAGGKALPRSGSDGAGYAMVRELGHSVTPRVFPALVPLVLGKGHWITGLSGISAEVTLELRGGTGKRIKAFTNSMLCTHFGISGPAAMDMSRYLAGARFEDPAAGLVVNWLPGESGDSVDAMLVGLGRTTPSKWLRERGLPERLSEAICAAAGANPAAPGHGLPRDLRRALARCVTQMPLPVVGDRGFTYAEVTAGGVPLSEVDLDTMESRVCRGLHLCGEILDVDGRIGGFNFQWAWASGHLAGRGAADGQKIAR